MGKRQPRIGQLAKIADALNVSIGELLDIDNILDDFGNHPEIWIEKPDKQSRLLKHYNSLNESGKDKAIERVEELTEIPRYTKKEE